MPKSETADITRPALGQFLKDLRSARQLTLRDVERLTERKISNGYLSQLENGDIASPSAAMLHHLAVAYGVDYNQIMEKAGFAGDGLTPVNRGVTSVFGELSDEEEEELLSYLSHLRRRKR